MQSTLQLTVNDVFGRPNFQNAEILAGKKGLDNSIRWVHVLEVTEIAHLLSGQELILTTAMGWRNNKKTGLSFLQQLVDKKASGLCVELGTYIDSIPEDIIAYANEHNFPIIVFKKEVRFIDITQDLNGLFLEANNKMMVKLEAISNQFNQLLLTMDGFHLILRLLHQSLDVQVAYIPLEGETVFYPSIKKSKKNDVLNQVNSARPEGIADTSSLAKSASKPVQVLRQKYGDLIILSNGSELTRFDYLVLERAATAISQDQLHLLYAEEKRNHEENEWVLGWLNGEHQKESIEHYFTEIDASIELNGCSAFVYETDNKETDLTYYSMIFRTIFERHGFYGLVSIEKNNLIFALVNKRGKDDWKSRLTESINQIKKTDLIKKQTNDNIKFGAGKLYDLDQLEASYKQAKETVYIQKKTGLSSTVFYEDLHIHRLILNFNMKDDLKEFTEDYLASVIEFDRARNGEMFETLKVLLEVNWSKKDAAEQLFIVRQTLYHRIEKLKELLGEDFMDAEKRLAIEFAVYARIFLTS